MSNIRYFPGVKLFLEIIKSGVEEKDLDYFYSEAFEHHCKVLNLHEETVRCKALNAIGAV